GGGGSGGQQALDFSGQGVQLFAGHGGAVSCCSWHLARPPPSLQARSVVFSSPLALRRCVAATRCSQVPPLLWWNQNLFHSPPHPEGGPCPRNATQPPPLPVHPTPGGGSPGKT